MELASESGQEPAPSNSPIVVRTGVRRIAICPLKMNRSALLQLRDCR